MDANRAATPSVIHYGERNSAAPAELDAFSFLYSIDMSNDGGRNWTIGQIEMNFSRKE